MPFPETERFLERERRRVEVVAGIFVYWAPELDGDPRLQLVFDAIRLLRDHDPRRHRRLRRFSPLVEVTAFPSSYWNEDDRTIWISPSRSPLDTAASLVHDATHAMLDSRLGPVPVLDTRSELRGWAEHIVRSEALCLAEEQRFVRRMAAQERQWSEPELELMREHEAWIEEVLEFGRSWLAEIMEPLAGPRLRKRPAERPAPPPVSDAPVFETERERLEARLWELRRAIARHEAGDCEIDDAELERQLRAGLRERITSRLDRARAATHEAARQVKRRLSDDLRRRSRTVRYWRDPWCAEILEGPTRQPQTR